MNDVLSTQVVVTQGVVGVVVAYVLQWLKGASWFPALSEQSTKAWKILLSGILAAASALAIGVHWNGAAGELLITGLTGAAMLNALVAFGVSFISQHASYELLIHKDSVAEPQALISDAAKILDDLNRKPLRPIATVLIIAALGLSLTAASCPPKTRHQLFQVDKAIATGVFAVQDAERTAWQQQVPGYTNADHIKALHAIDAGLAACDTMNHAVQAWKPGQPAPIELTQANEALKAGAGLILQFVPPEQRASYARLIAAGQSALLDLVLALTSS